MALQKRQDVETSELKGVVLAVDETKIKPGVFVRLSNWKPSGVGSIKKKRGVALLDSVANTPVVPIEDCDAAAGTTIPTAPSNLVATALSFFEISLTWDDNSADETNFSIERCSGTGCTNFIPIATVGQNETTYTDSTLDPDTTYAYRVLAYNQAGVSAYTNIDEATTDALPAEPPATDLRLWLDAAQIVGLNEGDPLSLWEDESGEGNDFTATLTGRPTYRESAINSLPAIEFDGIDDFISNLGLDTSLWTSATLFIVGKVTNDPAIAVSESGHWKWNPSNARSLYPSVDAGIYESAFTTNRKTVGDVTSALDQPHQYNIASAVDSYKARINRVTVYFTNINSFEGQNGTILIGSNGTEFYKGLIAEVILFEGDLTDPERNGIEGYLALKWDL